MPVKKIDLVNDAEISFDNKYVIEVQHLIFYPNTFTVLPSEYLSIKS